MPMDFAISVTFSSSFLVKRSPLLLLMICMTPVSKLLLDNSGTVSICLLLKPVFLSHELSNERLGLILAISVLL